MIRHPVRAVVAGTALALTAVVPFSVTALPVLAQEDSRPRGFFQAGYQTPDVEELNTALAGAGLPEFGNDFLTLGGGGFFTAGPFLIGGEGHGLLGGDETTPDGEFRTRLNGGYGMFNLGYALVSDGPLDLYPILGIGGGGMQLEIIERSSPTFDGVLADPGTSTRLSSGAFLLSASVAADWRFGADRPRRRSDDDDEDDDDDGFGGWLLGVRAGWVWAPADVSWELDELNDVAGGPEVAPTGFHIRVSIGGWG